VALGAPRPAVRSREPSGGRHQYRYRGCGAADGYTLLLVGPPAAINATLYEKLNFNFIRDIAPVAIIMRSANVMEVNPAFPAKTVPEFISYAKANPGKLNMASSGIGTSPHVSGELFKMMTGVDMTHVPYRGGSAAITDLLGGQVQVMFDNVPSSIEHIRAAGCARWQSPRRCVRRCCRKFRR
jgi:tripartite-type tricarboxylate transporter receptor subunit TctC